MKGPRVEVYFAMYLTAIISFFTVNELVERWKAKAMEREIVLIEVIRSLVDMGDIFEWADVSVQSDRVAGHFLINPCYKIDMPFHARLVLRSSVNPKDSIIVQPNIDLNPGSSNWEFMSREQVVRNTEYQLQLETFGMSRISITDYGRNLIKEKLLKSKSTKLNGNKINIDSLVTFISGNIQSASASIISRYSNPIGVRDTLSAKQKMEEPFIEKVPLVIAGTKNNKITFVYGNISMDAMRNATVRVGSQQLSLQAIQNNSVTYQLPSSLDEGTYPVTVSGVPGIHAEFAKVKSIRISIDCENRFYEGDELSAKLDTHGESVQELRWRIEREGAGSPQGEGRGAFMKLANMDRGRYTLLALDEAGNTLTTKTVEATVPPPPEITSFQVDSVRRVVAVVNTYGQRNGIRRIISGFVGTAEWKNSWDETGFRDGRREFKVYCEINPSDCEKSIFVRLKIEDKNGLQSNERKEKKTIKCSAR